MTCVAFMPAFRMARAAEGDARPAPAGHGAHSRTIDVALLVAALLRICIIRVNISPPPFRRWQRRYFTAQGHYLRYRDEDGARVQEAKTEAEAQAAGGGGLQDATATKGMRSCEGRGLRQSGE